MITIHFLYLVFCTIPFIVLAIFLHVKLRVKSTDFKKYRIKKDAEIQSLLEELLRSSENNLELFFSFESGLVESIKTQRIIKAIVTETSKLTKDIRLVLEEIKIKSYDRNV